MKVKALILILTFVLLSSTQVLGKYAGKSFHLAIQQQIVPVMKKYQNTDISRSIDYYWKQTQANCKQEITQIIQYGSFDKQLSNLYKCMSDNNKQEMKNCKTNFLTYAMEGLQQQMKAEIEFDAKKQSIARKFMFNSQLTKKSSATFLS